MKSFLIFCSAFISIWMFLPFIQDHTIFSIHNITKDYVDNSEIVLFIIMFLISSWFISIGYSQKAKVSIVWILGTLFYFYMLYHIIDFTLDYDDFWTYLFRNDAGINYVLGLLWDFWKYVWIGFYFILLWFLWNTIWIFGILHKTYVSLNNFWKNVNNFFILKTNPNAVTRDDGIRIHKKDEEKVVEKNEAENIANKKEDSPPVEVKKVMEISKIKLIFFFVFWNILTLSITTWVLLSLITISWEVSSSFTPWQMRSFFLGMVLSLVFLNLRLVNRYINRFIDEKILLRYYGWIWFIFLIIFYKSI